MYQANQIADFFLGSISQESGDTMSPLKLQKLVYYAQAWHLTIFKKPLFEEKIEAWVHGPVIPSIYERFKATPIHSNIDIPNSGVEAAEFEPETNIILKEVSAIYGEHSASYLEDLTHQEDPWINARNGVPLYAKSNNEITPQSMIEFYSQFINNGDKAS